MKIPILKLAIEQGHIIETREERKGYFHTCPGDDACESCVFQAIYDDDDDDSICMLNNKDKLSQEAVDYIKQHHPELLI
jgi:hypothetical protein